MNMVMMYTIVYIMLYTILYTMKGFFSVMWRQSPGAGVCSLWLRPSILHSTFLHVSTESLHNEVWPDLQYSKETRHESRGLPTITRPDNLWSELQDLMPVMSSKHTPRGLSGYSSKFLSPLHSGVPHVQWIRSCPLGQGWTRGWPHWGVWLAHEKPGSPAPSPNGPASGSSGKRNILDENICLKPRTLDD